MKILISSSGIVSNILALIQYWRMVVVVPTLSESLGNFGDQLPLVTRFVENYHLSFLAVGVGTTVLVIIAIKNHGVSSKKFLFASLINFFVGLATFFLCLGAMYLPIFLGNSSNVL